MSTPTHLALLSLLPLVLPSPVQDDPATAAATATTEPVAPTCTFHFDPSGVEGPRTRATVFVDLSVEFEGATRPFVIVQAGGGWSPGSGLAMDELERSPESLTYQLYRRGFAVVSAAYTVFDPALDGLGLFHPDRWRRDGDTGALVLDPDELDVRSSELDLVNAIQYLRHHGLPEVPDLDRRPGRGGMYARSAGSVNMNFVALGPDRANPGAEDPRLRTSTRLGFAIADQYIASFAAYAPGVPTRHHPKEDGARAQNLGAATQASIEGTSALCYAFRDPELERANAALPVHLTAEGTVTHAGPFEYEAMVGLFTDLHPPEHVLAMREALLAAGRVARDDTQRQVSRFAINPLATREPEAWAIERAEWALEVVERADRLAAAAVEASAPSGGERARDDGR